MPITPRNDANFKENLIDIIKLSYSADINKPFISGDKLLMGYSFSLMDDLDAICTQIYGANKAKVIETIRKAITNTTTKTVVSKIDIEKLFNDINNAARAACTKASGGAGAELPEFKFSQDEQLNAILESKLKPLVADIKEKLRGSSLANLEEVKLTSSGASNVSKEHVALLALLHISSKKNIDPALASFIKSKSRFKAWFWLAFESFSGDNPYNLKLLRKKISAQFGLYESDENNKAIGDTSSAASMERVSFGECIDIFTHLNISKAMYVTKDKNGKEHKEDVTHLEFMQKDEERSNSTTSKCEGLFKPFAEKLNSLLASQTSKKFSTENIYCVNLTSSSTSNASRVNKLLKRREEELYKQEGILILCPIKTATPIRIFQPKKSTFTIVLASQTEFDCSELNPKELNPSRPNYGKLNLCELILTDFKFDSYEKENKGASSDRDIKFKNAKTKSDSVILYKENDDGKDDKNKTKGACFTSIRQSSDEIEYKLEDGVVKMSHFHLPSSKDEYLNFNLLNFAKENNFTLRDDKDSAMFDMKLRLALGNNVVPTSTSSSSLALTLNNLIIENEKGEASDIDKIYLHHCGDKSIYESTSLVKNKDSDIKNSYTATFNIPIDRNDKKDTKLIVYSSDLSKIYDTKGIHAYTGTAIISIGYKDKSGGSFSYTNKVSLRDITDHIVNVVSDNEYPFKTNEEISLKAIYKQEKGDKRYKEVLWGYMVIKSIEYNEVSKEKPREVVELKDQKGKEIRFKISDLIKKDDLDKLKQGGHTIVFFAYLEGEKDKFKYKSVYGKNHIRIDIKIPLYIKFKDDKLIIYEFEHAIKEKSFKASINFDSSLINRDKNIKDGYYYINKNINQAQEVKIYEDENLNKTLNVKDEKNRQTLNNVYEIYANENSANNQILDSIISKDKKYGINLLSKDNMNSFINSFNESKSITRVDKGMWVDGDREVGVKAEIELCNCEKLYADKFKVTKLYESYGPIYRGKISLKNYTYWDDLINSNQVTEDEKNILIAMSENEGNLDAVQSYDSEVLSAGAMQKTVKSNGRGEFSKQLAKFRDKHPKLYITHAMNCGWKVVGKDSDATIYYSNSLLTYGNDITGEELKAIIRKDCNVKNYGKSTYNKPLAAIVKLISLKEFQELQVLDFIDRLHEAENKKLIINGKNFAIKDFVTTKFGRALILDQSVNRPNNVSTNFKTALDNFFADHPNVNKDPATWNTNHVMYENTLLEYYRDARVQMTDNIKRFNNLKDKLYENN